MRNLVVLLLLSLSLWASEKTIFVMTESYHTPKEGLQVTNNHNLGIGYEYTGDNGIGVHGGAYNNSFNNLSVFMGVQVEKEIIENLKGSIVISGATGYKEEIGWTIRPIMTWGVQYYVIRIVTTYPFPELAEGGSVFNLQLVYDF